MAVVLVGAGAMMRVAGLHGDQIHLAVADAALGLHRAGEAADGRRSAP